MPFQGDISLSQLTIDRKILVRFNIEIFKSNIKLTLNSDRISTENPTIAHTQIIEDRTKLMIKVHLNEIDIQTPKEREIIKHNKYLESSTKITS